MFGTTAAVLMALPLAVLAARNTTPARPFYAAARGIIALCRSVPDLVWALLFVTAVGLGPFPGALAVSVHSIGMLGRLFSEVVEDMDMGTVEALTMSGASRLQVFSHAVVPSVLPSLLGIALYRLDENIRASLVLGFVGAGGLGFQIADGDELVPVPHGVAAAAGDVRHRDGGRAPVRHAARSDCLNRNTFCAAPGEAKATGRLFCPAAQPC